MSQEAIFILRHGEREDCVNPQWRLSYQNQAPDDPPLAKKGHTQAKEVAQRLATERIDIIISSPYQRCVETANYVAETLKKPLFIEPGICEVLWEWPPGYKTAASLKHQFPVIDLGYAPTLVPHQSESSDQDCIRRVVPCARGIRERYRGSRMLLVGHGASVAGILKALTGETAYVGLCTLTKIVNTGTLESPSWKAEYIGDSAHLSDKTNLRAY